MENSILVVDDDAAFRAIVADELQDAGFTAVTAANVTDAIAALAMGKVNVVVSDVHMLGGSGYTLVASVREDYPSIPVVLMSSFAGVSDVSRARTAGAFCLLSKPFGTTQLLEVVERALARGSERGTSG